MKKIRSLLAAAVVSGAVFTSVVPAYAAPGATEVSMWNDQVQVYAAKGVDNRVFVHFEAEGRYTIKDQAAPVQPGAGCTAVTASEVRCTGVKRLIFSVLDGDDLVNAGAARVPVEVYGYTGNDTVLGGIMGDWFDGNDGDDNLVGYAGGDTIMGGAGKDTITGGLGDDILLAYYFNEHPAGPVETITCSPGADTVYARSRDAVAMSNCEVFKAVPEHSPF